MVRALVCLILLLALGGCKAHLLGTHDAELSYEPEGGASPADVEASIRARAIVARVAIDVAWDGGAVVVTLDQDAALLMNGLIRWRGGVSLYETDPTFPFALAEGGGLAFKTASGGAERWYEGASGDLRAALSKTARPSGRTFFLERLETGQFRTRTVRAEPLLHVPGPLVSERSDWGRALLLPVERLLPQPEREALSTKTELALVRDDTVLASFPARDIRKPTLPLRFGQDIASFTRAHEMGRLLGVPQAPVLSPRGAKARSPQWGLAMLSLGLPLAVSLAWMLFVRRFDRVRPEPLWLVLVTFALGALGVVPAGLCEYGLASLSPYLNPHVMTLGGQPFALPIALLVFTLVVGLPEEGAKWIASRFATRRREFDEPVDGIVYAAAAALGFAALENVKYFAMGRMSGTLITTRAIMSVPAHLFFSSLWGYALGKRLVQKRIRTPFFLLSALAHGAFDTFLSLDGMAPLAIVLNLLLGLAFLFLLRKALRHGVMTPDMGEAPQSTDRFFVRVGSTGWFVLSAALMLLFGTAVMVLGSGYEILGRRVGVVYLILSSGALALFGAAAFFLTETLPLDIAIDSRGITFGGKLTLFRNIQHHSVENKGAGRAFLMLHEGTNHMRLGPAPQEILREVSETIRRRQGR